MLSYDVIFMFVQRFFSLFFLLLSLVLVDAHQAKLNTAHNDQKYISTDNLSTKCKSELKRKNMIS